MSQNGNDDNSQRTLDGNMIDDYLLALPRFAMEHWGVSRSDAHTFFSGLSEEERRKWHSLTTADGAADLDFQTIKPLDPDAVGWALAEYERSPKEAPDYAGVGTADGEPVPLAVVEEMANPTEWDRLDPTRIRVVREPGDMKNWHIEVPDDDGGTKEAYADKHGYVYDDWAFRWVGHDRGECEYTYRDDIDVIHTDFMADHVDTVSVVTPDGKFSLESRSGVMWPGNPYETPNELWDDDEVWQLAEALSDGVGVDLPNGFTRVSSGWHSSMERSELSDRINQLTSGDVHEVTGWDFPVTVRFGTTNNICSLSIAVYAPEEHVDDVKALLEGKRAAPLGAGLR